MIKNLHQTHSRHVLDHQTLQHIKSLNTWETV
jgi:hypothetical protein